MRGKNVALVVAVAFVAWSGSALGQAGQVDTEPCKPNGACKVKRLTVTGTTSNCFAVDTNVLKVDCANNYVGVNMTPASTLDVQAMNTGANVFAVHGGTSSAQVLIRMDTANPVNTTAVLLNTAFVGTTFSLSGNGVVSSSGENPRGNNAYDLGTAALRWRAAYLTGTGLDIDGLSVYQSSNDYTFSRGALGAGAGDLVPATDNAQSIGSGSSYWAAGYFKGDVTVGAGSGTTAKAKGLLDATGAVVGNVGAGEDTLYTYTLPANTLNTTGRGIHFRATGNVANNANSKRLRCYFGATSNFDDITVGSNAQWLCEGWVFRIGSNAQRYVQVYQESSGTSIVSYQQVTNSPTETDTGAIVVKVTGEGVANNDIELYTFFLETL